MIVTFGILAPYISTEYTWRWVYLITSGIGIFAWIFLIAFVPESRKMRSKEELCQYFVQSMNFFNNVANSQSSWSTIMAR